MNAIVPYLIFNGNCKEAMNFYAKTFGAEITLMQTFGEAPIEFPKDISNRIFNSELKIGNLSIKASDDIPNQPSKVGTNCSLFLSFSDENTLMDVFNELSENGKVLFPFNNNFGMVEDQFQFRWMLTLDEY